MKRIDSLAAHAVIAIARQRPGFDAERCRLVIEHRDTSAMLHAAIHKALSPHRLSELQFGVLVVLFSLDPEPISAADLAVHTAVSRSAITEALDHLEEQKLIARTRDTRDRRVIYVRLSTAGRALAEPATLGFLHTVQAATRFLNDSSRRSVLAGYALLQKGAASLST